MINELESTQLGKVVSYEPESTINKNHLVGIPRVKERSRYGIREDLFTGFDVWHEYEFSCLMDNGCPFAGIVKIVVPANSRNIVESKSLKLYFNSFNFVRLGNKTSIYQNITKIISEDLSECLGIDKSELNIGVISADHIPDVKRCMFQSWYSIDEVGQASYNLFDSAEFRHSDVENPSLLEYNTAEFPTIQFKSSLLRSNCRVTNQPDWADIFVHITSPRSLKFKSFIEYIASLRKENHFHEETCELIYKRLFDILEPTELLVACLYTRRGGIDINPIRTNSVNALSAFVWLLDHQTFNIRTIRQ